MLLENKNAIIYGGGGSIGGAVAREFSREGARVFLVGRTRESLEMVANDIEAGGGSAEVAVLDVLDEKAVDEHVQDVVSQAGSIATYPSTSSRAGTCRPSLWSSALGDVADDGTDHLFPLIGDQIRGHRHLRQ